MSGSSSIVEGIIKFFDMRRHPSGGYTLYEGLPDSKNTYYAIRSLEVINSLPDDIGRTLDWLEELHSRGSFAAQGLFYRCRLLADYGREFRVKQRFLDLLRRSYRKSKLEITYYMDSVLRLHDEYIDGVPEWVLSLQNDDGGFGRYGSDIINTHFAVEILEAHGVGFSRKDVLEFADSCWGDGGWNFTPLSYPPYLETAYAGFKLNEILRGRKYDVEDFILKLRNPDGGFRRSLYMGISEPEYTYRAVYMLFSGVEC